MKAYDLSYGEAVIWARHLWYVWEVLEAQFEADGPSETLGNSILLLLVSRDNQIYMKGAGDFRFGEEFRRYLADLQDRVDAFRESITE